jgi:hypothetical protein
MTIRKYGGYWAVIDAEGTLVCLCVYREGAEEVVRRLTGGCQVKCVTLFTPAPAPQTASRTD